MKIVVSARAVADLERLREFLAPKNAEASQDAVDALISSIAGLSSFPERYPAIDQRGTRSMFVRFGKDGYIVYYNVSQTRQTVVVLRIWHGREQRR